jgi:hypothetical protein
MKRLTLCLALVLPLVLAGAAEAKKLVSAKVCGASGCRTVDDRDSLTALAEGGPPTGPPKASGFYQVDLTGRGDGERFTFTVAIVPEAGLMRGGTEAEGYTWMPVSADAVRQFRRMTRGIEPFPAAKLAGLDVRPPEARVDEVVLPPEEPGSGGGGAPVWPWIVFGLPALGLVGLAIARLRRPRPSPGPPEPAEG